MCKVCDGLDLKDPKAAKFNLMKIAAEIGVSKDAKHTEHLWDVSNWIIDSVEPMVEPDKDVEKAWHDSRYKKDDE